MISEITAEGVFLNLVRLMINNKKTSALPDGITADDIFAIGSKQDMAPITFCALNTISPKPDSARWTEYQKRFFDDCMRSEVQMSEYKKLVAYLCRNGVKVLPLKGCVIKDLYPVLLPFAWLYRIIDVLLHRRSNVTKIVKADICKEKSEQIIRTMQQFGLECL